MKNILVISDLHFDKRNIAKVMPKFAEADLIFFCGDGLDNFLRIAGEYKEKIHAVKGNCDGAFFGDEEFVQVEDVKILITHGHRFGVKSGLFNLCQAAKENGASVAFFGHTHDAIEVSNDGVRMINPGAISDYMTPSYYFCTVIGEKLVGRHVIVK